MKFFSIFIFSVFACTGCTNLSYQEMQYERDQLRAELNTLLEQNNPDRVKETVKELLVGKWQCVSLETGQGSLSAQYQQRMSAPSATESETNTPSARATRLPPVRVTSSNQRILAAKVALLELTRKDLVLEFREDRSTAYYSGSDSGRDVAGRCSIITQRYGDIVMPFITFRKRVGPDMSEFLFGSEMGKPSRPSYSTPSRLGVAVTADTLSIVLYGGTLLLPGGEWMRTDGVWITFKRIK